MEHVLWYERPTLRTPTLVAAFTGWNDAGDAASLALAHLLTTWRARKIATIDPEEFFEFQATRPHVRLRDGQLREIVWPANELWCASTSAGDVLLLAGTEPQLRWRTFTNEILEMAKAFDTSMVMTFGALLADVPHNRPVNIIGTASDQRLIDRFELQQSRYEGPTGIVGVLQDACNRAGLASVSLWGAVPAYAPQTRSPKVAMALIQRFVDMTGAQVDVRQLERDTLTYEREISSTVADDDDLSGFVRRLAEAHDSADDDDEDDDEVADDVTPAGDGTGAGTVDRLVEEVERFLRDQGT
jgi:proteasome assembly chaperone (PAC2) family protein